MGLMLDIEKVPKAPQDQYEQHEVEKPRCGLREFVATLEQAVFNSTEVETIDEMVHC
jgi:hypothetical protein